MKQCPYCAEEIQDEAIKCKHCGEMLEVKPEIKPKGVKPNEVEVPIAVFLFIAVLCLAVFFLATHLENSKAKELSSQEKNRIKTVNTYQKIYKMQEGKKSERKSARCQLYKKLCYAGGYGGGEEDRDYGRIKSASGHYNLPIIQIVLSSMKQRITEDGKPVDEKHFDDCCRFGFTEGYNDGYSGYPQRGEYQME